MNTNALLKMNHSLLYITIPSRFPILTSPKTNQSIIVIDKQFWNTIAQLWNLQQQQLYYPCLFYPFYSKTKETRQCVIYMCIFRYKIKIYTDEVHRQQHWYETNHCCWSTFNKNEYSISLSYYNTQNLHEYSTFHVLLYKKVIDTIN